MLGYSTQAQIERWKLTSSGVQKTRTREATPLWTESSRSGTCKLYSTSHVYHWRDGESCKHFYKQLAAMVSVKRSTKYNKTIHWIRCKLSFALLRASIMSIREARSFRYHAAVEPCQPDLQLAEGHIRWTELHNLHIFNKSLFLSQFPVVLKKKKH